MSPHVISKGSQMDVLESVNQRKPSFIRAATSSKKGLYQSSNCYNGYKSNQNFSYSSDKKLANVSINYSSANKKRNNQQQQGSYLNQYQNKFENNNKENTTNKHYQSPLNEQYNFYQPKNLMNKETKNMANDHILNNIAGKNFSSLNLGFKEIWTQNKKNAEYNTEDHVDYN